MKYRKRPIVIEAVQFTEALAIAMFIDKLEGPFGLHASGTYHPEKREVYSACIHVNTLEGKMRADLGDWIIRGVKSELYPCKPDIFEATYEPVEGSGNGWTQEVASLRAERDEARRRLALARALLQLREQK